MTNQFNWDFDEEQETGPQTQPSQRPPWWRKRPWLLLLLLLLPLLGVAGGWQYARLQLQQAENERKAEVQTVLDRAHEAYLAGDGDQFFSTQSPDPAWRAAQLRPESQSAFQAGLLATRVQQQGDILWVNATWPTATGDLQRILFFQWQGGQLVQIPTDSQYWGPRLSTPQEWGRLLLFEADQQWSGEIAAFVVNTLEELCAVKCLSDRLPVTLVVENGYEETAVANEILLPSPRLLGIDETGHPGPLFWQQLHAALSDYLTPATIRFVVPQQQDLDFQLAQLSIYYAAARDFMAENPHITVGLVAVDSTPEGNLANWLRGSGVEAEIVRFVPEEDDLLPLLAQFDGVGMRPTEAMLASGLVRDLTRLALTDMAFNEADFYEQVWQGTLWRDRVWMVPYMATMRLVYYDKNAYLLAGLREPSLRWTWDEMVVNLRGLTVDPSLMMSISLGFIDASNDTLYAYAYNWNNSCTESATVRCQQPLAPQNVAAALDWYQQLLAQPNFTPDMARLTEQEREDRLRGLPMMGRTAAMWVDAPSAYEDYVFGGPVGVVPFPGSDRFDGVTPLAVQGGFITQTSQRPLAVWQWLKFLSYYQLPLPTRYIPARPSVATQTDFWNTLPPSLGDAMRTAFPFARPIRLDEQGIISWDLVASVTSGTYTPADAAQSTEKTSWFGLTLHRE